CHQVPRTDMGVWFAQTIPGLSGRTRGRTNRRSCPKCPPRMSARVTGEYPPLMSAWRGFTYPGCCPGFAGLCRPSVQDGQCPPLMDGHVRGCVLLVSLLFAGRVKVASPRPVGVEPA